MLEAFNRAFEEESATKARVQSRLNVDFDKELRHVLALFLPGICVIFPDS